MEELINKIQIVINTLDGGFEMPLNYKNCATLVGCINFLVEVRDELKRKEDGNGASDSE